MCEFYIIYTDHTKYNNRNKIIVTFNVGFDEREYFTREIGNFREKNCILV